MFIGFKYRLRIIYGNQSINLIYYYGYLVNVKTWKWLK